MADILLIRHGETRWNQEEIFRGQADIPLNDFGRRQAGALGEALFQWKLKDPQFFSSPLSRAYETACIAAAFYKQEKRIVKEEAFNDICFGKWEGKTLPQVRESYPELFALWEKEPEKVTFPGGESLDAIADRTEKAIYRLAFARPHKTKVIISHRAVNKTLLCRLLGLGSNAFWKLRQNTACINELNFTEAGFILVKLNDTCHLMSLGKDQSDL